MPETGQAGPAAAVAQTPVALHAVTRVYRSAAGPVTALREVTAGFAGGSFTAVMGPSGSGKSTLLHCAAGLDRPDSGEVILAGTLLRGLSENRLTVLRRRHVGFVFQSFNLLPYLTAGQNVALPLRLAGRRPRRDEIGAALAAVGLEGRAGNRPAELSGGQQQRVAIARALITSPQVIFADEPTGSLDSASGHEVLVLLRRLADQRQATVVMVTHDPAAASRADRVLFLADGRLAGELADPDPRTVADRLAGLAADASLRCPPGAANPSALRRRRPSDADRDWAGHDGTIRHGAGPDPAGHGATFCDSAGDDGADDDGADSNGADGHGTSHDQAGRGLAGAVR